VPQQAVSAHENPFAPMVSQQKSSESKLSEDLKHSSHKNYSSPRPEFHREEKEDDVMSFSSEEEV
jgi:hypothetical protein